MYSAVLSSIFLKERLSFQGKIGCLQCILGAIVIVLHAPEQSSADTTIEAFKHLVISVGMYNTYLKILLTKKKKKIKQIRFLGLRWYCNCHFINFSLLLWTKVG